MTRRQSLVIQHLEGVSRSALERYQSLFADFVRGRRGVYALYRKHRLYYVGLASNMRGRLRQHLRDRHGMSWDRFSVYLTDEDGHLRELEALVMRIVRPKANRQLGRFARSENLAPALRRGMREHYRREEASLLGRGRGFLSIRRPTRLRPGSSRQAPPLARFVSEPIALRARFKGKLHRARIRRDGLIRFRGQVFRTPSAAARALVKRQCSGWDFWEYERSPGVWTKLKRLRR